MLTMTRNPMFLAAAACGLIAGSWAAGPAQAGVLFSTGWDNPTATGTDSVLIAGTARGIAITGGGSNLVSPSGFWTVTDATTVDLSSITSFTAPASITGTTDVVYGATSGSDILRKGAVFTTLNSFVDPAGTGANIRYATNTGVWRPQFNVSSINNGYFNVLFEIKPGSDPLDNWTVSFNYGTAQTNGSWDNNTAAQNGTVTATIYRVNATTGVLESPFTFNTFNASGAGPLATLSATSATASLSAGNYLLSIQLSTAKTSGQRFTIDNLAVSAEFVPEPASLVLFGLGSLLIGWRKRACHPVSLI
jgi:hypothetical protein